MSAHQARIVTNPIADFLTDIAPVFAERAVIYADVGANDGRTFKAVLDRGFAVDLAVLIEANPTVFDRLQDNIAAQGKDGTFTCLNLSISDQRSAVRLDDTQVVGAVVSTTTGGVPPDRSNADPNQVVKVDARRFDDLADLFPDGHVSILRIADDGHELQVLRGCDTMLSAAAIDVLYIEVGAVAGGPHETLFRSIDDLVTSHGYQLFRIYQPFDDWVEGSSGQRRFILAYVSPTISGRTPVALSTDLSKPRKDHDETAASLAAERNALRDEVERQGVALTERYTEIAQLTGSIETIVQERDAARAIARSLTEESENRRKNKYLFGILGIFMCALAAAIPIFLWFF